MTITPANFAAKTITSSSLFEARNKVLKLYRDWQRAAPKVVKSYLLDIPASAVRAKIREEFEKNRYVSDLKVIDVLRIKGETEFQETINSWKMESHVMRYFDKEDHISAYKPQTFLEKFYEPNLKDNPTSSLNLTRNK
ncbi:9484_t:CDS:2 [Diversispora eburnea]|uniref:9484_t:CDS:1 n=1 Tax=Diversispora eburnea TaxID=1213867 RepID=A0A9N8YL35_9GLOM|nr:9484_t:CDS:2 [Diversispora eburnea]